MQIQDLLCEVRGVIDVKWKGHKAISRNEVNVGTRCDRMKRRDQGKEDTERN